MSDKPPLGYEGLPKLLAEHLPRGDLAVVRNHDTGFWDVAIFEIGTCHRLMTVAEKMDRLVATLVVASISIMIKPYREEKIVARSVGKTN